MYLTIQFKSRGNTPIFPYSLNIYFINNIHFDKPYKFYFIYKLTLSEQKCRSLNVYVY